MDYTEISNSIRMMIKAQGVDDKYIDKEETLYYDESGNVKHLIVKEDKLNADSDTVFVLGGVQADDTISLEELKTALGKSLEKEMKSTKDLKGSFIEILRKDNFRKILQLIQDKGWHIHFCIVQVLYYGFVDIVDSINGLGFAPLEFKAELYKVLKKNPNVTVSIFKKYKYPNIATKDIKNFLSEILTLIEDIIAEDAKRLMINPFLLVLKSCIEKAKEQKELTFIQEETAHEWVGEFEQFYKQQILNFPKKTLVFDEEKQVVEAFLCHSLSAMRRQNPSWRRRTYSVSRPMPMISQRKNSAGRSMSTKRKSQKERKLNVSRPFQGMMANDSRWISSRTS